MADAANKYAENVAGKYYVDNQCIDCDLCRETAPDNFKRNDDGGYSIVYKQPFTPEEETRCKEAKEGCPVGRLETTAHSSPANFSKPNSRDQRLEVCLSSGESYATAEVPASTGREMRMMPDLPDCGGTISSLP